MKILFLNPHRSDFVFQSVAYATIKRRSLKKYGYLSDFFDKNDTDFLFIGSSIFRFLSKLHISFLDYLFLQYESHKFKQLNSINNFIHLKISSIKHYNVIFCFGFSIRDISDEKIRDLIGKCDKFIIHLSHYHLYANKLRYWASFKNVTFCADADIRNNFFFNYFVDSIPPFFILTYTIDARFNLLKSWEKRQSKIISTGTYHEFEKIFSHEQLINDPISGIFGSLSLHPERRIIEKYAFKLPYLECKNSSMGAVKLFTLLRKKKKVNQSNYFSFDIVTLYNEFKYAFIGEETITGLPGIGVFEAIVCGCIPIVNKAYYSGTPLENERNVIFYHNINDLINIILNFDKHLIFQNFDDLQRLSQKTREFYSSTCQIKNLESFLSQ